MLACFTNSIQPVGWTELNCEVINHNLWQRESLMLFLWLAINIVAISYILWIRHLTNCLIAHLQVKLTNILIPSFPWSGWYPRSKLGLITRSIYKLPLWPRVFSSGLHHLQKYPKADVDCHYAIVDSIDETLRLIERDRKLISLLISFINWTELHWIQKYNSVVEMCT